jgi:hypothetical protein
VTSRVFGGESEDTLFELIIIHKPEPRISRSAGNKVWILARFDAWMIAHQWCTPREKEKSFTQGFRHKPIKVS